MQSLLSSSKCRPKMALQHCTVPLHCRACLIFTGSPDMQWAEHTQVSNAHSNGLRGRELLDVHWAPGPEAPPANSKLC